MTYSGYCKKCNNYTRHFRDSHPDVPNECLDCLRRKDMEKEIPMRDD